MSASTALVLSAEGAKFQSGLAEAQAAVSAFARNARGALGGLASLPPINFAKGLGLTAFTFAEKAISDGYKRIGEIAKTTRQATTLGVDVESYQGWAELLKRSGKDAAETGEFFTRFSARMEDAARTGRGPLSKTLEAIGVDIQQISKLPIDQQMLRIADAMQALGKGGSQTALALHAFGDASLLPQLQQGSAGLQKMFDAMKEGGQIVAESDAKSAADAAKSWKVARDTIARTWDSFTSAIAVALSPVVKVFGDAMGEFRKLSVGPIRYVQELMTDAVDIISEVVKQLKPLFVDVFSELKNIASYVGGDFVAPWDIVKAVFHTVAIAGSYLFDTLRAGVGVVRVAFGGLIESLQAILYPFQKLAEGIVKLLGGNAPQFLKDFHDSLQQLRQDARDLAGEQIEGGVEMVKSFGKSREAVDKFFDNLQKKNKTALKETKDLAEEIKKAVTVDPFQGTGAILSGSAEALAAQVKFQFDSSGQIQVANQQLAQLARTNSLLDSIRSDGIKITNQQPALQLGTV